MPLLATITPGTMSIFEHYGDKEPSEWVYQLDFPYSEDHIPMAWHDDIDSPVLSGTTREVSNLLLSTALAGVPLPTHKDREALYSLLSYGPALKCMDLSDAVMDPMMNDVGPNFASLQQAWDATDIPLGNNIYKGAINRWTNNYIFIRTLERNITCNFWNASYQADYSTYPDIWRYPEYHVPETHLIQLHDVQYLAPTNFSTLTQAADLPPGGRAYQSIFAALASLLVTEIGQERGSLGSVSPLTTTYLTNCKEMHVYGTFWNEGVDKWHNYIERCPGGDVTTAFEQLSQNFTLSFFNYPGMCGMVKKNVLRHNHLSLYKYDRPTLLAVDISGGIITLCCILVGLWSIRVNGYCASNSFSTVMFTTRNRDLDRLAAAHCLGSDPLPGDVRNVKLRFGNIGDDHIAFGLQDTVTRLRKGQDCH